MCHVEDKKMKALLIIDIQNGLTKKKTLYNETYFLETINAAIKEYSDLGYPVIFVQHNNNPLKFGTLDWEIDNRLYKKEEDITLQKQHGNAFLKTDLKFILDNKKIKEITVCGLVSHGCVKATCIGGLNEGYTTNLLKNGHTNWNKDATVKIDSTENELNQIGIKIVSIGKQPPSNESKKDLHEMTTEELGQLFPIIIIEPNKDWEKNFNKEKTFILDLFEKTDIENIEHIGSTAIPNLKAKPTIDILLEVSEKLENELIIEKLKSIGYDYIQRLDNPPPHMMFVRRYSHQGFNGQAYHLHVRFKGDWDEIYFRDYLRENKQWANDYETLKLDLAIKYKYDREAYTEAKTEFVEKVNKLARKEKTRTHNRVARPVSKH